jgi:hypothetical protein
MRKTEDKEDRTRRKKAATTVLCEGTTKKEKPKEGMEK